MNHPRTYRWAATALFAYAGIFVLMSLDVLVRIWAWRHRFERAADPLTIAFFELSRTGIVIAAILLGLYIVHRRGAEPALRALAVALGFGAIAFAKVAAFPLLPGAIQERSAAWLLAHDVPRAFLGIIFGRPGWAGWLAIAALLLFAARYPHPVSADAIAHSGRADRTGLLRANAIAGADIGALFRALATRLLNHGMLAPAQLAAAAIAVATLHYIVRGTVGHVIAATAMFAALGVVVTLLRAGYDTGDEHARRFLDWLTTGALAALILFAASAAADLFTNMLGVVLLALAPVPALGALAAALLWPDVTEPARVLARLR